MSTRRMWARAGLLLPAVFLFTATGRSLAVAEKTVPPARPNIVFVLVDDLRYDAMSCAGHPFVRTPNVDRIAERGVRFTNAFVTHALCAPSRATFLTGTYSHVNGVRTNEKQEFDHAMPTFPLLLQKAGYETAFVGKWHMKPTSAPRPGFDYWLSFMGQGVYENPRLNENGREFKAEGYMTDLLNQYALEFLSKPRDRPFCLCLWHKAVHEPFTPAERHTGMYADAGLPEPASFKDTFEGKPKWMQAPRQPATKPAKQNNRNRKRAQAADGEKESATQPAPKWDPKAPRRIDYFRSLAAVDEGIGQIFDALRRTGQLDNTVFIFAGDNGYLHGEHRLGDKRVAYEESIRIPLVIGGAGVVKPGRTADPMVLNLDMAQTILDLAGVAAAPTMQGLSLRPLLAGETPKWRESFLYEYYKEQWLPRMPTIVGVRTREWKYVRYPEIDDIDELYDLTKDPIEMHNRAADPDAKDTLVRMRDELNKLQKQTGYVAGP